jgi:hypothetical protein
MDRFAALVLTTSELRMSGQHALQALNERGFKESQDTNQWRAIAELSSFTLAERLSSSGISVSRGC